MGMDPAFLGVGSTSQPFSMTIDGVEELAQLFHELPIKIHKKVMGQALTAASRPVRKEMRRRLKSQGTERTRALWKAVGTKLAKVRGTSTRLLVVGIRSMPQTDDKGNKINPVKYAHLVEFGTEAHTINPRLAGIGVSTVLGPLPNGKFAPEVHHPGAKEKPFIRPAWDSQKAAAVRAFELKFEERLTIELAKDKQKAHLWPPGHKFAKR